MCPVSGNVQVKVSGGVLQGFEATTIQGGQYYSFLGVPFAEPPVGGLRFKAPVPKKPWTGVLDATKEGSAASQLDIVKNVAVGKEDCLYLNVYTPKLPEENDELLPVMFYIHGGGFVFGSGSPEGFSPDFLVDSDVILVSTNYRLGVLGFLCLDTPEVPGNAGLKDQVLAMKWVQENIRAFNGDPDNVTIFGISAGAASVEYHLLSPMSKGLFHKAILQSGSSLNPWARCHNPKKFVTKFCKMLGIREQDPNKLYKMLQGVNLNTLVSTSMNLPGDEEHKNGEMFAFTPVVEKTFDGVESFLTKEPFELLEDGLINKVPTITGFCEVEGPMFKLFYSENTVKDLFKGNFIEYLPENYNVDKIFFKQCFKEIYTNPNHIENSNDFLSDLLFLGGIYESLKHRCRFTNTDYFYMFAHDGNINFVKRTFKIKDKGTYHGDDTSYLALVKDIDESTATDEDKLVRSRMVNMWTNFAKTGDPTPKQTELITTEWLPATSHNMHLLEITKDLKMKKFPHAERIEVWENIYESSVNTPRQ